LNVILLSIILKDDILLSAIFLNVILLSIILKDAILLSAILLNVILPNVGVPQRGSNNGLCPAEPFFN
jgi:hypothetical protein